MALLDANNYELNEKVVAINRVSKTVKGGRIMKFSALVVVGDGNGVVGFGMGKSNEVPDAIRKGLEDAKKNLHKIALKGTTIPHEVTGKFGAGAVLMRPASRGYRRYRRRPCSCSHRDGRHQEHPYKVPAFQQPLQRCSRNNGGSDFAQNRRGSCCSQRQDRKGNCRLSSTKGRITWLLKSHLYAL